MSRKPSAIDELSNAWVVKLAELSPSFATYAGFAGGEDKLDDLLRDLRRGDIVCVMSLARISSHRNDLAPFRKAGEQLKPETNYATQQAAWTLSFLTGNYIDNCFIELSNEHDDSPTYASQYSFGGITITG